MPNDFDHVVLSPAQEQFLARFLNYKTKKSKSKQEKIDGENREKRADYKAFLGTQQQVEAMCQQLRGAGVDVGAIAQGIAQLAEQLKQSKTKLTLEDAFKQAGELRRVAVDLQQRVDQQRDMVASLQWLGTPPPGANMTEVQQLTQLCRFVSISMKGLPPSVEDLMATRKVLGEAALLRTAIVKASAERRSDTAAVTLALAELRQRQADAQRRLAALAPAPEQAPKFAARVDERLTAMAAGLQRQNQDGLAEARAAYREATEALQTLDQMLAEDYGAHVRQTIQKAGAGPVSVSLTKLAQANPAAFDSAISVLDTLRKRTGGDLDDGALAALETSARDKLDALASARLEVVEMEKQLVQLALEQQAQAQPQPSTGRAGRRGGANLQALLADVQETMEMKALKVRLIDSRTFVKRCETKHESAEQRAAAGRTMAELMQALRTGPLSAGHGQQVKGPAAAQLIELYARDAAIARDCMATVVHAEHPEAVARCGGIVCDTMEANSGAIPGMEGQDSAAYARRLVKASADCDAATMDGLPAYLVKGRAGAKLDLGGRNDDSEARRQLRTGHVRQAALRPDGTLDTAAGRDALMDVTFHPDALLKPAPAQAGHMRRTLDFFEDSPDAQRELQNVQAPVQAGVGLVRRSANSAGAVTQKDARAAVMNAMLTPVYQGGVGSCFATSGVITMRTTRPLQALRAFKGIAEDGLYRPHKGDPVSAVDNPNVPGDPLVRSLEYSAATATAKSERSNKRAELEKRNQQAMRHGLPADLMQSREALAPRLAAAVGKAVDFDFDPSRSTERGADGRSEAGVYVMRSTRTGEVITPDHAAIEAKVREERKGLDQDAMEQAVKDALRQAEAKAGDAYWENVGPIIAEVLRSQGIVMEDKQLASTKRFFLQAVATEQNSPWKPTTGGQTHEAAAVILGLDGRQVDMTQEISPDKVDGARSREVMLKTMDRFLGRRDQGEDMAVMRTVGQHGFNGLPTHPSLAPLLDGGKDELAANFDRHVVQKGKQLRETELPRARLQAMFRKDVTALAGGDPVLLQSLLAQPPEEDMTPGAYQVYLGLVASGGGIGMPDEAQKARSRQAEQIARMRMIEELEVPQFVIADTNWGDDGCHHFFVMVPDPTSGELKLFVRSDPGGELQEPPGGAKAWLAKSWAMIT